MKRLCIVLLILPRLMMADTSTLDTGSTHLWAGNIGWSELVPNRPNIGDGLVVADSFVHGYGWSDSTGWIHFGDSAPTNGVHYSNTDAADFGVNHDGAGNLSGFAWSANLGWINFGWWAGDLAETNRPHFDLSGGDFHGYAWSANAGWITLETGLLKTSYLLVTDSDNDGISDSWENDQAGGLGPLSDPHDADGDGASDLDEYLADTDPLNSNDLFRIIAFVPGDGSSDLTWVSSPSRHYRILLSETLSSWVASSDIVPDEGEYTMRIAPHAVASNLFFAVEAFIPLPQP